MGEPGDFSRLPAHLAPHSASSSPPCFGALAQLRLARTEGQRGALGAGNVSPRLLPPANGSRGGLCWCRCSRRSAVLSGLSGGFPLVPSSVRVASH